MFLTSAVAGGGGQRYAQAALPQGKRLATHCTGGWVGLFWTCTENLTATSVRTPDLQPVSRRRTDYAIPAAFDTGDLPEDLSRKSRGQKYRTLCTKA